MCETRFSFYTLQRGCRVLCGVVLVVCLCVRPVSLFPPCSGVLFLSCVCVGDLFLCLHPAAASQRVATKRAETKRLDGRRRAATVTGPTMRRRRRRGKGGAAPDGWLGRSLS